MIHRDEHLDNFTLLNNAAIEDENLSAEAFRLLVFMLSCADSWHFSLKGLSARLNVPERTLSHRITELRQAGYIQTKWSTNQRGQFQECEWDVFEIAQLTASPKNRNAVKPQRGKTATRTDRNAVEPQRGNLATTKQVLNRTSTKEKQIQKETRIGAHVFKKPTAEEVLAYCLEKGYSVNAQRFVDHYESNGWKVGRNPMKDWKAAVRNWANNGYDKPQQESAAEAFARMLKEEGYE